MYLTYWLAHSSVYGERSSVQCCCSRPVVRIYEELPNLAVDCPRGLTCDVIPDRLMHTSYIDMMVVSPVLWDQRTGGNGLTMSWYQTRT